MSYTPQEQQIDEPLDELIAAIQKVRNVLWARVRANDENTYTDWSASHIKTCRKEIKKLTKLELRIS